MLSLVFSLAAAATCTFVSGDIRTSAHPVQWFVVVGPAIVATSASPPVRGLTVSSQGAQWSGQDCDALHTDGAVVTAGLVAVGPALGLVEINAVAATRQQDAGTDSPFRASYLALDSYNPLSSAIPVARVAGVTDAIVFPSGGVVAGQAGWVQLAGDTQAEAVASRSVAMGASRDGHAARTVRTLSVLFDDARALRANPAAVDRGASRTLAAHPSDLRALWPVLDGELPLVMRIDRAADIEVMMAFAGQQGVRLVIDGGAEAWRHAQALALAQIAVIVDPMLFGPGGFDQLQARADNAALLVAAGVDVIIGGVDVHSARLVTQKAGIAVANGMSTTAALEAITSTPARVFGLNTGVIAAGAPASFVVWRSMLDERAADPLELSTSPSAVWIAGQAQPMRTRQTELRERYRTLPGTPLSPLQPSE